MKVVEWLKKFQNFQLIIFFHQPPDGTAVLNLTAIRPLQEVISRQFYFISTRENNHAQKFCLISQVRNSLQTAAVIAINTSLQFF